MTPDDPFDPCNLALPPTVGARVAHPRRGAPRPRNREPFLKGPVPWRWLEAAARLPGQALQVGLQLWFEAGCKNRRTVRVTHDRLMRLGMSRSTAHRGLKQLADAGLIAMSGRPGRACEITIRAGAVSGTAAAEQGVPPGGRGRPA